MTSIKVSDYLARRIAELGVRDVFMISGGGAMHLNDSIGRSRDLRYICQHHEQASAMAVEGFAKAREDIGVAVVTSGPAATNAVTGVLGQWQDSVPALYLSGQMRYDTLAVSTGLPLRHLGDQEAPIVQIVAPITKYAVMVTDPGSVRYHFDRAVHLARSGRPGPVWLDLPLNVQGALVDEEDLVAYDPQEDADGGFDRELVARQVDELVERLLNAERPVLLGGSAVRYSRALGRFRELAGALGAPIVTAWNAQDLLYDGHPLWVGRPSMFGDRGGNFAVQNADLLLSVGCRLSIRQVGYEHRAFARAAFRAVVDIDPAELRKPTIAPHLRIHADVRYFLDELASRLEGCDLPDWSGWLAWCRERQARYPVVLPEQRRDARVNPYVFMEVLSGHLDGHDIVVVGNAGACIIGFQALRVKDGQRLIGNNGTTAMGFDLPASIGACIATGRRVVCVTGDGSIQMNLQELQTIVHHHLPIKVFVLDNGIYSSIRQTQDNVFAGHHVGESPASGVSFPDMVAVAEAYGIPACRADGLAVLDETIGATLAEPGPALCDVLTTPSQTFAPRVASERLPDGTMVSKPLEDMFPFLPRDEFADNMLIPPWTGHG